MLGTYAWTEVFNNIDDATVTGNSIATDSLGNIYIVGSFSDNVYFGGASNTSCNSGFGDDDMETCSFIVKLNSSGTFEWVDASTLINSGNGLLYANANDITTDSSDNVYITGNFYNTVNFGGANNLTSLNNTDAFIVKYSISGAYDWGEDFTDGRNPGAYSSGSTISTDGLGNVYVTGGYYNTVTFDGYISTSGKTGIFISKFGTDGTYDWTDAIPEESGSHQAVYSSVTDSSGDTYVTGSFNGTVDFGGSYSLTSTNYDAFIAEYDTDGAINWAVQEETNSYASGEGIVLGQSGNLYIIGDYQDTLTTGGIDNFNDSGGNQDAFIAEYSASGNYDWAKDFDIVGSGGSYANGNSIAIDNTGKVYVAGIFYGTVTFDGPGGNDSLTSPGTNQDAYLTSYIISTPIVSQTNSTTTISTPKSPDTGYGVYLSNPLVTFMEYAAFSLGLIIAAIAIRKLKT